MLLLCLRLTVVTPTCLQQHSRSGFQLVQNAAGRLLTGTKEVEHITPILASFHWLLVNFRINYKTMLVNFLASMWLAPGYCISLSF